MTTSTRIRRKRTAAMAAIVMPIMAAARSRREGIAGAEGMLREAWERYRLPLAVTEAHIGCTREEQLRWFMEVWRGAEKLRAEGVDVRAVTAWSLLGAFDWNSLLTRNDGCYESGAYDLRGGTLRPTAVARMIETIAHGRELPSIRRLRRRAGGAGTCGF